MATRFCFRVGVVLTLTGTVLSACLRSRTPAPAGEVASRTAGAPLKVALLPFLSNSVLRIGEAEGYFAEQGLAVEVVNLKSVNDCIPAMVQGMVDVATPPLNAAFFNAVAAGARLRFVLSLSELAVQECTSVGYLARRKDVESAIYASPSQWKGARIAFTTANAPAVSQSIADLALRQGGLTLRDMQVVSVEFAAQAEALRSGQVDIVSAVEPWVTRMDDAEDIAILMPDEPFAPGMTVSLVAFGGKALDNPDLGRRFAIAYLKAVRQYMQGKTERNVELVAAYTGLEPALVRKICWSFTPTDGSIHEDSLMAYQTWLREQGQLDRVLPAEQFLDTSFIEYARGALAKESP